ncbi:hypothetical protein J6590_063723 [Homalodisca vitripennis]|nr:hypothetical protein J6590_063723 [Homalodisca vitripennis]
MTARQPDVHTHGYFPRSNDVLCERQRQRQKQSIRWEPRTLNLALTRGSKVTRQCSVAIRCAALPFDLSRPRQRLHRRGRDTQCVIHLKGFTFDSLLLSLIFAQCTIFYPPTGGGWRIKKALVTHAYWLTIYIRARRWPFTKRLGTVLPLRGADRNTPNWKGLAEKAFSIYKQELLNKLCCVRQLRIDPAVYFYRSRSRSCRPTCRNRPPHRVEGDPVWLLLHHRRARCRANNVDADTGTQSARNSAGNVQVP